MYDNNYRQHLFNDYSNKEQQRAKVKVKETDPAWSQILFFPVTVTACPVCSKPSPRKLAKESEAIQEFPTGEGLAN